MLNEVLAVKLHDTHDLLTAKIMNGQGLSHQEQFLYNQATCALEKHFKLMELLLDEAIKANTPSDETDIDGEEECT